MTGYFTPISKQMGSIGAEIWRSDLIVKLSVESRKRKNRKTPLEVVDTTMDKTKLSKIALEKFETYREKISQMDYAGAIRYTANFYRKGLATYAPAGTFYLR